MSTESINFQNSYSLQKRLDEAKKIKMKYPDKIPVVVEIVNSSGMFSFFNQSIQLDKKKYLVDKKNKIGDILHIIRKRTKINRTSTLYLHYANNEICNMTDEIGNIYEDKKDADGFIYLLLSSENTFG